jgi:monoamine oxidase
LLFATPFWEQKPEFANAAFFYSLMPVFPTWWKRLSPGVPVLTGWSAGPAAARLTGLSEAEIISRAVGTLEKIVGLPTSEVRSAFFHDWQSDPFSRGAYSYVPSGSLPAREILAQPVMDALYFAGEATISGHSATVHGAIASGRRAARQILEGR